MAIVDINHYNIRGPYEVLERIRDWYRDTVGLKVGDRPPFNNRGFWLGPAWQRQGLMTEAVEAVTAFWFEELHMATLRAPKAVANLASRRISEKTGMRLVESKESDYVSGRLPTEGWEITAEEWRARQKTQYR